MKYIRFGLIFVFLILIVACGGNSDKDQAELAPEEEHPFETSFEVKIQDGSKVFTPKTRMVTGNTGKINVKNTLNAVHGFLINELNVMEVVNPNSTLTLDLNKVEPGEYTVDCQLHSAHKHAKLVVKAP